MAQRQPHLGLVPQALQQKAVVPAAWWHGFQRVQRGEIAVAQLQQKGRLALVGCAIDGKTIRDPVRFFAGNIRYFSIQRISDLVDQVFLFLIAPFPCAIMANAAP